MRLVKKRVEKLNDRKTASLLNLVLAARDRDAEFFDQCEKALEWLKGDQFPTMKGGKGNKNIHRHESMIKVNLAHAHVRSLVPSLFFREPTVKAWPLNPIHEKSASAWEDLINAFIRRSDYKVRTKEVVLDAAVYPEAWKKWVVHHSADDDIITGESDIESSEQGPGSAAEIGLDGPNFWDDKFTIRGSRISPRDVITDSPDRKPENCRFVAIRYSKLPSELILDDRYEDGRAELKKLREKSRTNTGEGDPVSRPVRTGTDITDDRQPIVAINEVPVDIYEVWVYQLTDFGLYKQVVTLCEDCKLPLRQPVAWEEFNGPYLNSYPFNNLSLLPIPDSRGHSELAVWYSLQKTMNWIVSKIITQVDNRKQLYNFYPKNAEHPNNALNQFHSGKVREAIAAKEPGVPVFEAVPHPGASNDDFALVDLVLKLVQHVTGLTTNRRGATGARTATEADIIEGSAQIKMDEKADTVSDFIKRDMEILVRLIRAFTSKETVFRVTGNVGAVKWQQFTMEDAAWSPDVDLEPESFRRSVSTERLNAMMTLINILPGIAPALGPNFNFQVLLRRFMELLEIPNPQEITQDDVPSEVKQMAEITQMILGVGAEVLPTDDHMAEMAMLEAFMTSEVFASVPPEAQQVIQEHYQIHAQMAQQAQGSGGMSNSGNAYDDAIVNNGNPASEARQVTADSRSQF
jgi:hypothetical protein